jgi:glycosyltransferase involved in cell wall biosynthesis
MKTDKKPFFSVVLPTLNRADYLVLAIQSVLNQTFGDFELIISDNFSTDNTEAMVKSFSDQRIRYVKTEKTLPMYESWEFALGEAKGKYITFLGDDDAHSLIYLESLQKVIDDCGAQIVSCRMANYYYQNLDNYKSESLTTPPFSNKLLIYDSRQLIKDIYVDIKLCKGKPQYKFQIPQLINTAYHNSVFSGIKSVLGRVFPKVLAGDFYLAAAALSFTEKYYYLDSPLSFHGISPEGTTASITNQPKGANLKKTQPELARFKKAPLNVFTPYNFVADALMLAKSDLGEKLNYFELDLTGYFVNIYYSLNLLELEGRDISEEKKEFAEVVSQQELSVQTEVRSIISNKKNKLKNRLRLKFHKNSIYQFLRDLRHLNRYKTIIVEGKKTGFANIAECAVFVGYNFLNTYKTKAN